MYRTDFSLNDVPARLRCLYLHWQRKSSNGPPLLADFDLTRLPDGMDNLILTEILRDAEGAPTDFEPAFLGTEIRARTGPGMVGRPLSRIPGKGPGSAIWNAYSRFARECLPALLSLPCGGPPCDCDHTLEIVLPLGGPAHHAQYALAEVLLCRAAVAEPPLRAPGPD